MEAREAREAREVKVWLAEQKRQGMLTEDQFNEELARFEQRVKRKTRRYSEETSFTDERNLDIYSGFFDDPKVIELLQLVSLGEDDSAKWEGLADSVLRGHPDVLVRVVKSRYHSPQCAFAKVWGSTELVRTGMLKAELPSRCCLKPKQLPIFNRGLKDEEIRQIVTTVAKSPPSATIVRTASGIQVIDDFIQTSNATTSSSSIHTGAGQVLVSPFSGVLNYLEVGRISDFRRPIVTLALKNPWMDLPEIPTLIDTGACNSFLWVSDLTAIAVTEAQPGYMAGEKFTKQTRCAVAVGKGWVHDIMYVSDNTPPERFCSLVLGMNYLLYMHLSMSDDRFVLSV